MVDVVDCEHCGTALSYGEVFRHRMALDVATGRIDAKRILGDRLSPRKPRPVCSTCRTELVHAPRHAPVESQDPRWILPLAAAIAGVLVLTVVLHTRRA